MDAEQRINALKQKIRDASLDLSVEEMRRLGYKAIDLIIEHLTSFDSTPVTALAERETMETLLREPVPEEGQAIDLIFREFQEKVLRYSGHPDHPRFFAYIPSSGNFISILADALVAGCNFFAGTWIESPGPSQVELVVIDWFKEFVSYPKEAGGLMVSGGSVANLIGLATARQVRLGEKMDGAVIYFSNQTHASVDRAIRVLGFRQDQIQRVPVDSDYRMLIHALADQIERDVQVGKRPFCVVANAGTTNTGAIDPLPELAEVCQSRSLWLHVDAAYGGFAVLTERGRKLLQGLERADSITLDPHKWLYQPYEAGCVLVKDASWLRQTFQYLPDYMREAAPEREKVNFCDYGLQLTRQFRALKIWMSLKKYGVRVFREVIDQCLDLTQLAEALLDRSPVCEILSRPQLGIVCFRYVPQKFQPATEADEEYLNQLNEKLVEQILQDGRAMLTSTRLGSRFAIRFCILNHRTRKEDVEETVTFIEQLGKEAEGTIERE